MVNNGLILYPKIFCDIAKDIALARWLIDKEVRNSNSEYTRDNKERELEIETKGILGEMIARYHLEETGKTFEVAPLIAEHPLKEADIVIGKHKIDVKSSHNPTELMVNENAHLKGKGKIDFYWFIVLEEDGKAGFYLFKYDDVNKWELGKMTYTNAYVKTIFYSEKYA